MSAASINNDEQNLSLRHELEETKAKLASAEELLRAIRGGEVDALVVEREGRPAVYTLKSADEPYRLLIDQMAEGALTVADNGIILYCNAAFAGMIGQRREKLTGRSLRDMVDCAEATFEQLIEEPQAGREVNLRATSGELPVLMSSSPVKMDGVVVHCIVLTDVSRQGVRILHEAIVESSADAIFAIDKNGKIKSWNPAAEKLFGLRAADVIDAPMDILLPPDVHKHGQRMLRRVLHGETVSFETEFAPSYGENRYIVVSLAPIRENTGVVAGVAAITRDITATRIAEVAVRDSERQFRTLANAIPLLCWMANADGGIFWYNDGWYEYTGTTPQQMEGWGWTSVHDPAVLPAVLERWRASIATGQPFDMVFPIRGSDGVFRPFLTRIRALRDQNGNVVRWFGTNTDITEQRRIQDVLKTQADLLKLSFDPIIVWHLDGAIESWNDGAEKLYGFTEQEAVGRVTHDLLSTKFPKPWPEVRANLIENGVWEGELVHRGRDGNEVVVSARQQLIRDDNGATRVLEIIRDITEKRRTEEALRASHERIVSLNEQLRHVARVHELGQVSAGIAHELNQPLAAMLNYANVAKRLIAKPDGAFLEKAQDSISKATEQAIRAGEIIRRMRDFVEKRDARRALEDVNAIVSDAVALALVGSKSDGIATTLDLAPDLPPVEVDRVQIEQVMVNLLRNAIDAVNGSVERTVTVVTRPALDKAVIVTVTDTGPGVPSEIRERLFQPFATTKPGGMGIGLSISRSIIEAHAGQIDTVPNPGGGTQFYFTLPAKPEV